MSKLLLLSNNNCCRLRWVPGHNGIKGNEEADLLANAASAKEFIGPEPALPIALSFVKQAINSWVYERSNTAWQEKTTCKSTKLFFPYIDCKKSSELIMLPRKNLKIISSFITGHCKLRKHLCTIGLLDEPSCPKCFYKNDTPEHHITSCSFYAEAREAVFNTGTLASSKLSSIANSELLRFLHTSCRAEINMLEQTCLEA
jgi:hypothetical protein